MSLEDIKSAATALAVEDRKRLIGFLLDLNRTPEQRAEQQRLLAEAIDDKDPKRWLTLEQVKERLEQIPEPPDE